MYKKVGNFLFFYYNIKNDKVHLQMDLHKTDKEESTMSQLFGMDNILSTLAGKYDNKVNKETAKAVNGKNSIGNPKLTDAASKYYEELKSKYGDMEFVLVADDQIETAKAQASNIASDKSMIVLISESELEEMATNKETRAKNEKLIEDARTQMPEILKKLKESGMEVKSFGIEVKDDALSYFAVLDKSSVAQKERIEAKLEEKRAEKKADEKEAAAEKATQPSKKEDLVTISANSIEELIKKLQTASYEAMADNAQTPQEKMVGQSFDLSI